MIKEYPTKHAEYSIILQERERQRIAKEYSVSNTQRDVSVFGFSSYFIVFDTNVYMSVANATAEPTEGRSQQGSRVHKESS